MQVTVLNSVNDKCELMVLHERQVDVHGSNSHMLVLFTLHSLLASIEDYLKVAVTSTQDALQWLESRNFLE